MRLKVLFSGLFLLLASLAFPQKKTFVSARDTTVRLLADDPIAAQLDSLAYLKLFETTRYGGEFGRPGNFGFTPDSVPVYSPQVLAERIAKMDAQSPFKLIYNDEVKAYINMYSIRKRNQVSRMIGLSELYFPLFEETLAKYKMPLELKYLAIVESALNPAARSRVGAQGLWQFMYGTGKLFKLNINSYVDERCDPIKSTEAACLYMKYLYSIYKDWSLVLAAYNSGPGNVNKAIRRSGGKTNYWDLRPYLPRETAGYVPAFIAAVYVMNYSKEHNLYPIMPKAIFSEIDTLHIHRRLTFNQLSAVLDMPVEDIAFLNPSYLLGVIPETEGHHILTLPKSKVATFINNEETIYSYKSPRESRMDSLMSIKRALPIASKTHVVRSGESISAVARKYGVTVNEIKKWNKLKSAKLKRGQRLKVSPPYTAQVEQSVSSSGGNTEIKPAEESKSNTQATEEKTEQASESATPTETSKTTTKEKKTPGISTYKVRPGDTLWKVAVSHGMTLAEIRKLNGFTSKTVLRTGMKIKVKTK
ncbi:MAG TPA: transglycosylase SLT domain-containing protein [Flavobacteriales bacterium]|nr:transglycosylase SLT domain-containing protein [Flavobacteriales bacterium]